MPYLPVGDGHTIYYEEHGSTTGKTAVVCHGGPGGGLTKKVLQHFNLRDWRVILFDQRGCGRSTPFLETRANTTWHLVRDMERLREAVGADKWLIYGGSWGSTLALAYASRYSQAVSGMVLRGIYLGDQWENDWLYREGGASRFYPKEWGHFVKAAGGTRKNLVTTYSHLLRNRRTRHAAARAWWGWESAISHLKPKRDTTNAREAESLAVLENHYFRHRCWLRPGQLLRAARQMRFPVRIVQGAFDMVCPPAAAQSLADALPNAKIEFTIAGHAGMEPATSAALKKAVASFVA
jgi:proline iminopeptidase